MTDNEQGYTPTDEQAEDAVPRCGHEWGGDSGHLCARTPGHAPMVNGSLRMDHICGCGAATAVGSVATLAAHRVTLVADSREALINWFFSRGAYRADAVLATDALLASGVVQVTTPTETDEVDSQRVRVALAHYGAHTWDATNRLCGCGEGFEATFAGRKLHDEHRMAAVLVSRPAPESRSTDNWEDPEPYYIVENESRHSIAAYESWDWESTAKQLAQLKPRTREQYEAEQKPAVPVDALGFPTQVGATFRASFGQGTAPILYTVGKYERVHANNAPIHTPKRFIDPASIEDVRPADGRGGQ